MYGKKKMMYGGRMARENKMGGGMSVNKEKRSMMKHGGKHNDRIMYAGGGMAKKRMAYGHGGEVMPKAKPC